MDASVAVRAESTVSDVRRLFGKPSLCGALLTLFLTLATSAIGGAAQMAPPSGYLAGYASAISGQPIDYQSYFGDATLALLSRVTDPVRTIEWRTQAIPGDFRPRIARFTWIAGYAVGTSGGDRRYDLYVDGVKALRFTAFRSKTVHAWRVIGKDGISLSFRGRWYDVNGDYFGDMFLNVPVSRARRGHALRLKVVGENAHSNDWYMTFEYAMRERVVVEAQPALELRGGTLMQPIALTILHTKPAGTVRIDSSIGASETEPLTYAINRIELGVPAVRAAKRVHLSIAISGMPLQTADVTLQPVHTRTFYLISHSHDDVGYSDTQPVVFRAHNAYMRQVLTLIARTRAYPEPARFRWSEESLWVVENFLDQATDAEKREFIDDVKDGYIGLSALYGDELTGLNLPEELLHVTQYAGMLEDTYGIRIDTAMISDVPGYSWGMVPALTQREIPYFSVGPNFLFDLPMHGDRVGWTIRTWGDKPFYWQSPSGTHRVLFWMAGHGYSSFHNYNMRFAHAVFGHDEKLAYYFMQYAKELAAKRYPYEMVQVRYTQPADNGPPDPLLPGFVRAWNERYVTPKIVLATVSQTMGDFDRRYGKTLKTYTGDFTPYWTDGAISTAREEAIARASSERLVQAATVASIRDPRSYSPDAWYPAWRNLVMWHEHSWGAYNSTSDPDSPFVTSQWAFKQAYALDADRESRILLAGAEHRAGAPTDTFDVYNTESWARTDVVYLSAQESKAGDVVVDARGNAVASQRLADGELAFLARDVPPLSAARYAVVSGTPKASLSDLRVTGTTMANAFVRVTIDPRTGAIRELADKTSGAEFAGAGGLNAYYYVPGRDPAKAVTNGPVHVAIGENGPLVASLVVTSQAPGAKSLRREIRLIAEMPRVDVTDTIDKERIRTPEAVHLGFPFDVPGGSVRLDLGWAYMQPGVDQLPGANEDFFTVNRWADVSNGSRGITLATVDAPLVELGHMTNDSFDAHGQRSWSRTAPSGTNLYSYVMNNYWYTNFKADQEGPAVFRYSLAPHGAFDGLTVARFGMERSQPLLAVSAPAEDPLPAPVFRIQGDAIATSVTPSRDGKAEMIRIFNPRNVPANFTIEWGAFKPAHVFASDLTQKALRPLTLPCELPRFGVLTIRAER
jgi:alpha-mannosidase